MENSRIVYLVTGYLNDALTELETNELQELLLTDDGGEAVAAACRELVLQSPPAADYQPLQWESLLNRVLENARNDNEEAAVIPMKPAKKYRWAWAAAASLTLLAGAGIYFFMTNKKENDTLAGNEPVEVQPGRQGALLTLADGSQVLLDTIQNGVVALQGGATAKVIDGALFYDGKGDEIVYNTMSTPIGRQFQLTLPDGTRVWLNAASSIRYPTVFKGTERKVEVTGESYFEVARNTKMPFLVSVGNATEVEVLGTDFNISGYSNEASLNTTLIDGSVRVKQGNESVIIKPGEQAQVNGKIRVEKEVDLEKVTAWKNGLFNFKGSKLEDVMRQLERWYGIEVVYENGIPDITLGGEMSKDIPLKGLMIVLQKLKVQYRLEGKKLTILPSREL
ncbi:MAG: FecR domain-containing protein [Chitinophagaceae bacterium]|nr:FecR domain-containing protein [Chitinophagaceae bacterium]